MLICKRDRDAYKAMVKWAIETFIKETSGKTVLAVVQTLKQKRKRDDNTYQKLDQSEVAKLVEVVKKEINRSIYGSAYRNHKKMVPLLCSLEGKEKKQLLHLNFALALPSWMTEAQGMLILKKALRKKVWCKPRSTLKKAWTPEDWFEYMTKEHDTLLLEVSNFPLAQAPQILPH